MRMVQGLAPAVLLAACLPMYVTYLEPSAPGATVRRATACNGAVETYRTVLEFEDEGVQLILSSREMRYAEDEFVIILQWEVPPESGQRLTADSAFVRLDIPGQGRSHLLDLSRSKEVLLDPDSEVDATSPVELPLAGSRFYSFSFEEAGFGAGRAVLNLPELRVDDRPLAVPAIELRVRRTVAIEFNC